MDCSKCLNYVNNKCTIYEGIDTKKWHDCCMKIMPKDMDKAYEDLFKDGFYLCATNSNEYKGRGLRK